MNVLTLTTLTPKNDTLKMMCIYEKQTGGRQQRDESSQSSGGSSSSIPKLVVSESCWSVILEVFSN